MRKDKREILWDYEFHECLEFFAFEYLKEIEYEEPLEKDLWEDVEIFSKFDSFVESKN